MTIGKYFNRGVMALDTPHIGHVVKETDNQVVVFGERNERFDIPISEIRTTGRNVLIGLTINEIQDKYLVNRNSPIPVDDIIKEWNESENADLASFQSQYPNFLFSKGVRMQNEDHLGHVMKETEDKIVVFGSYNHRFDIPKSEIYQVGANVILKNDFPDVFKYQVDASASLPVS
jgi:sporulation protein YlmC with PRC-barrel domain